MSLIVPKVFLIGETSIIEDGFQSLLDHLGVSDWKSDASSDSEKLTEVYGRACYMSFESDTQKASVLNKNLTRVRHSSKDYLQNILEKGDGSVLEHASANFFFADVSRVFTAELCRHRVGIGISEQSLRFVRLTDLDWYASTVVREDPLLMSIFSKSFEDASELQKQLALLTRLDEEKSFDKKKEITSALRRLAPLGLATNIGWSANFRALRHVIEMRTNPSAEEEIRLVFGKVAEMAMKRWPNLFGDYIIEMANGLPWYKTEWKKV